MHWFKAASRFSHYRPTLLKISPSSVVSKLPQILSRPVSELAGQSDLPELKLDTEYNELSRQYFNPAIDGHGVLVIQPFIKWGRDKRRNTTPQLQLSEAEALIRTLPRWSVVDSLCISLLSLKKQLVFGKGNLQMLQNKVATNPKITAVFISINLLRHVQINELQDLFGLPVYDRYSIVIQIFREHARTHEAKIQVALAELPYIWKKLNWTVEDSGGRINLKETRRMILHAREAKLRRSLEKCRDHRKLIRNNRVVHSLPSVAVVGYTNAGKTCLIKSLTGSNALQPENKLFATLDTTAHAGFLPCMLKVVYMDTIGFIQDIPEGLLEPFLTTFEDAIESDVIVHVFDASHPDKEAQIQHVRRTLSDIMTGLNTANKPIIEVANKCDLVAKGTVPDDILAISALNSTGIDLLRQKVEEELLRATKRKSIKIRVRSGSSASAWLYKETTVTHAEGDPDNPQYLLLRVIATEQQLFKFKQFLSQ